MIALPVTRRMLSRQLMNLERDVGRIWELMVLDGHKRHTCTGPSILLKAWKIIARRVRYCYSNFICRVKTTHRGTRVFVELVMTD